MNKVADMYDVLGRQNEFRNKENAQRIAKETGGEFIDKEFKDIFGSYWIVKWRKEKCSIAD